MTRIALVVVLALAGTACSSRPWRPPQDVDHIAVGQDLVARVEADGSVSVTAIVKDGDLSAPGTVRLSHATLAAALASPHVRLARARAWQALAMMLASTPERAYAAARAGALALEHQTSDDSGLAYKMAEQERADHLDVAVAHMADALATRIGWYVRHHHAEAW